MVREGREQHRPGGLKPRCLILLFICLSTVLSLQGVRGFEPRKAVKVCDSKRKLTLLLQKMLLWQHVLLDFSKSWE